MPPENVADLAKGGRGAKHYGRVVAVEKPQDGHRGAVPFAQPVPGLDRYAPVVRQRGQYLLLFIPELDL